MDTFARILLNSTIFISIIFQSTGVLPVEVNSDFASEWNQNNIIPIHQSQIPDSSLLETQDSILTHEYESQKPSAITIKINTDKNQYVLGEKVNLTVEITGNDDTFSSPDTFLEICIPTELDPLDLSEPEFNWETGCWRSNQVKQMIALNWVVARSYEGIVTISAYLYLKEVVIAQTAIDINIRPSLESEHKLELWINQETFLAKDIDLLTTDLQILGLENQKDIESLQIILCPADGQIMPTEEITDFVKSEQNNCYQSEEIKQETSINWDLNKEADQQFTGINVYLFQNDLLISMKKIYILFQESGVVKKDAESRIKSKSGRLNVVFPKESAIRNMYITIIEEMASDEPSTPVGSPIRLNAFDFITGEEINQFEQDIQLEWFFEGSEIENDPYHYAWKYFSQISQVWIPIDTKIDMENKMVVGTTDHFTDFQIDVNEIFISQIPALNRADVNGFTGSASYQVPIQVPPGPGGFSPAISINYNSQVADTVTSTTQSSIVGFGWNLNAGAIITRNNQLHSSDTDDTFNLQINNVNYELVPKSKTGNIYEYYTKTNEFLRILRYDPNCELYSKIGYWEVWDKSGNKYTFSTDGAAVFDQEDKTCSNNLKRHGYAWYITEMKNASGLIMKYIYQRQNYSEYVITKQIYLDDIVYPDQHTRIHFVYTENRKDYLFHWNASRIPYNQKELSQIQVMYDPWIEFSSTTGSVITHNDEVAIFSYQLNYFDDISNPIFPNLKWEYTQNVKTGRYLTLESILWLGKENGVLSEMSFKYDDFMHLTEIDNHNGGRVQFEYENYPWYDFFDPGTDDKGKKVNYDNYGFTTIYIGENYGSGFDLHYPGQILRLNCQLNEINGDDYFRLFASNNMTVGNVDIKDVDTINIGDPNSWSDTLYDSGTYNAEIVTYLYWRPELAKAKLYLGIERVTGTNTHLNLCRINRLVTRYRVIKRTLLDSITSNVTELTYDYEGARVNENITTEISWLLTKTPRVGKSAVEFRGHEISIEIDNIRQVKTVTHYYQTDELQGYPWKIESFDISGETENLITQKEIHYGFDRFRGLDNTNACAYDSNHVCYEDSLVFYWVRKEWEVMRIYANDGIQFMGIKQSFAYENIYGNLLSTITSEWDGNNWIDKIKVQTDIEANDDINNNKYIVSLPSYMATYQCPNGICSNAIENLINFQCNIYEPASGSAAICAINSTGTFTEVKPSNPLLMGKRSLVEFEAGIYANARYLDQKITYDQWGNLVSSTQFSEYGSNTAQPINNGITEIYTYDNIFHSRRIREEKPLKSNLQIQSVFFFDPSENCYWFGKASQMIDANGHKSSQECDQFGRIIELRKPGDETGLATTSLDYTPFSEEIIPGQKNPSSIIVTQKIDDNQVIPTQYFTDGIGRTIQTQQLGVYTEDTINMDLVQTLVYDEAGRQIMTEIGRHAVVHGSGYDESLSGYYSLTGYDNQDRMISVINPDGTNSTTTYEITYYDESSKIASLWTHKQTMVDSNGHTQYQYSDVFGRTIATDSNSGDLKIEFDYDILNNLTNVFQPKVENPTGAQDWVSTNIQYDMASRKINMQDPDMGFWTYRYDGLGNLVSQTDARNVTTALTYDLANRMVGKSFSEQPGVVHSTASTYTYDGSSIWENFESGSMPSTFIASSSLDVSFNSGNMVFLGNGSWGILQRTPASITDGESISLEFNRNAAGGVTSIMIDKGTYGQTTYRRFALEIDNGSYYARTYTGINVNSVYLAPLTINQWNMAMIGIDRAGKFRLKLWNRDEPATLFEYEILLDSSWRNQTWTFKIQHTQGQLLLDNYRELDRMGFRTSMAKGMASSSYWEYDQNGRIIKQRDVFMGGGTFVSQWTFNSAGLLTSMTYPGGNTGQAGEIVNYSYNERMLLDTMIGTANYITASDYDQFGHPTDRILSNGVLKNTYEYYAIDVFGGRLQSIKSGTINNPTSIQNLTYQDYDENGNLLRLDNPYEKNLSGSQVSAKTNFEYDELNRLTNTQMTNLDQSMTYYEKSFQFDQLGRLVENGGTGLSYNDPDRIHAVTGANGITYQYDANGNMIVRNTGIAFSTVSFLYDSENRLVSASTNNITVAFSYDADGVRYRTYQNTIFQPVILVSGTVVTTYHVGRIYDWTSSTDWKKYYYAGSQRMGFQKYGAAFTYLFSDHLGSLTVTSSASGGSISRFGYYPFGESRYGNETQPFQYTGQRKEVSIGLYDYNARFYDSMLGRFVQADTYVPESQGVLAFDRYAYVNNSPINGMDPTGYSACWDEHANDPGCKNYKPTSKGLTSISRSQKSIGYNGWDLVPVISEFRGIVRGSQSMKWAYKQPDFLREEEKLQAWYNNCFGGCHYPEFVEPGSLQATIGGPMPETPVLDTYSQGAGEVAGNGVSLLIEATYARLITNIFAYGGKSWHVGWQTNSEWSIIHVGNAPNPTWGGIHLAIGSVGPRQAFFHIYFYPHLHIYINWPK